MKRAAIFFFYDKDGIVDRYIPFLLDQMIPFLNRLVIVVNGKITNESKYIFDRYAMIPSLEYELLVRENNGFDVWAYKEAIEKMGWDNIASYDELILFNFTIMGPVSPFAEMFSKMEHQKVDFWGITVHYGVSYDPSNCNPYGYLPVHLQSHFVAFRKKLTTHSVFRRYWEDMPPIHSYEESVGRHESYMTKYFSDKGFRWMSYVDSENLSAYTPYPLFDLPDIMMRDRHCPIFKRKNCFINLNHFLQRGGSASASSRLLTYLKQNTDYDVKMLYENIVRTCCQWDYEPHLNIIRLQPTPFEATYNAKIAVFLNLGEYAAVIDWKRYEGSLQGLSQIEIIECRNGKKNWQNLFTGAAANFEKYNYVFVVNPSEIHTFDKFAMMEQVEKALELFFGSKENINGILQVMKKEPYIGLAGVLRPLSAFKPLQSMWKDVCQEYFQGFDELNVGKSNLPYGSGLGIFCVRTQALSEAVREMMSLCPDYDGRMLEQVLALLIQSQRQMTIGFASEADLISEYWAAQQLIKNTGIGIVESAVSSQLSVKQHLGLHRMRVVFSALFCNDREARQRIHNRLSAYWAYCRAKHHYERNTPGGT